MGAAAGVVVAERSAVARLPAIVRRSTDPVGPSLAARVGFFAAAFAAPPLPGFSTATASPISAPVSAPFLSFALVNLLTLPTAVVVVAIGVWTGFAASAAERLPFPTLRLSVVSSFAALVPTLDLDGSTGDGGELADASIARLPTAAAGDLCLGDVLGCADAGRPLVVLTTAAFCKIHRLSVHILGGGEGGGNGMDDVTGGRNESMMALRLPLTRTTSHDA